MKDKKKQSMRYSEEELSLIKNTFAENEELLKTLRKFFWQFSLDPIQLEEIKKISAQKELVKLLRKTFLPFLEPDAPFQQVIDLWMTIKLEGITPENAHPIIQSREKLIQYLDQQLKYLENEVVSEPKIYFKDLARMSNLGVDSEENYINLVVRNMIISHVEMQLNQLIVLAGDKEETVNQTIERLKKDSMK